MQPLTEARIAKLKAAATGKRVEYADAACPGMVVRTTDKGHKTFCIRTRITGRKHPVRLEIAQVGTVSLEEARDKAREWLKAARQGIDPRHLAPPPVLHSFGEVCEDWLARHVSKHRQSRNAERTVRRELLSKWRDRQLTSITRQQVTALMEDVATNAGATSAHSAFTQLRAFMNWAVQRGVLEHSPCTGIRISALVGPKGVRDRVLSHEELRLFWAATEHEPKPWRAFHRLLLLTGMRKMELAKTEWAEFADRMFINVPASRSKMSKPQRVALSWLAIDEISKLPQDGRYVFSADGGKHHVRGFHRPKARLDKLMGNVPQWGLHDLRRTFRTELSRLRIDHDVAEAAIGHSRKGIHRVYDLYRMERELKAAVEEFARHLEQIVGDPAVPRSNGRALVPA